MQMSLSELRQSLTSCRVRDMHVQGPMPMLLPLCYHAEVVTAWVWVARDVILPQFNLSLCWLGPSSHLEVAVRAAPAKSSRRVRDIHV